MRSDQTDDGVSVFSRLQTGRQRDICEGDSLSLTDHKSRLRFVLIIIINNTIYENLSG